MMDGRPACLTWVPMLPWLSTPGEKSKMAQWSGQAQPQRHGDAISDRWEVKGSSGFFLAFFWWCFLFFACGSFVLVSRSETYGFPIILHLQKNIFQRAVSIKEME